MCAVIRVFVYARKLDLRYLLVMVQGIAGLLAHLKQRIDDVQYQNWLIYGERQSAFDHVLVKT